MSFVFLGLGFLDNGEFDNPPNGGCYDVNRSYIAVKKNSSTKEYEYYIQLVEVFHNKYNGIITPTMSTSLKKDSIQQGLKETPAGSGRYSYTVNAGVPIQDVCPSYLSVYNKNGPKDYQSNSVGLCAK